VSATQLLDELVCELFDVHSDTATTRPLHGSSPGTRIWIIYARSKVVDARCSLKAAQQTTTCCRAEQMSRSAMPGWQGLLPPRDLGRRRAQTAVNPNLRRYSHVHSACQRPYA
jgi:hypothetical protein